MENNVFAMRDRVFNFGAVIAHMGPEDELARLREASAAATASATAKTQLPGVQVRGGRGVGEEGVCNNRSDIECEMRSLVN